MCLKLVSFKVLINHFVISVHFFMFFSAHPPLKESGEKRVGFQDDDDQNEDEENDKRPVSKLHRRDTPHHLKNKRVQQHLNDKAANVILNKLKERPHLIPTVEEVQTIETNPMPLVQDVGLPIVDHIGEINQNGIEIPANVHGEF